MPQFPNDANPAISESAISMTLFETALASGGVKAAAQEDSLREQQQIAE
ncbi:hypothetical protein KFU94_70030 [Chloroflexi bacterium TSY]|nr:hypothetical protein [Chloroflexi bacterium TSY]